MRVCVTAAGCSRLQGGLFYAMQSLWKSFAAHGHQVEVKAVEDAYTDEDKHAFDPLPVKIFRCLGPQRISWSPQMIEYMQAQGGRHDLISSEGLWSYPDYAAGKISGILDIPHVIHPHGMLDPWALQNSRRKKQLLGLLFQKRVLSQAGGVRALCDHEQVAIRKYGYRGPVAVIPNGVDPQALESVHDPKSRQEIDALCSSRKVLLFLSRVHPKKNLPALIRAWKKLEKKRKDWVLVIAGPDEVGHSGEIRQLIQEKNLSGSVLLTGPVFGAAKSEWLRCADGFILPSRSEGFPMVLLEAAAMGVPCIQTPQCHFPELVKCGGSLMTTPRTRDLIMTLNSFLELSSADHRRMGEQGRKLIQEQYLWPHQAAKMEQFFQYILSGDGLPGFVDPGGKR